MARNLAIRRYRPADADAVWAVHEAALQASPLPFVDDAPDEDLREVESRYLEPGGEFLVGERDGDVVAIGGYHPIDERTVELRRMRVAPEHQRDGFASQLLAELEDRARDAGFDRVELETVETLEAARAFYRDHGYAVVDRTTHPVTGDELLTFRKSL